ncbi:MAG TPA: ABC transporter permease [Blastocatellia bacterium]|nr:ABC transporter permease [Blastocatellia bacterium]
MRGRFFRDGGAGGGFSLERLLRYLPLRSSTLLLGSAGWLVLFLLAPLLLVVLYSFTTRGPYGGVQWIFSEENYRRAFDALYLGVYWRSVLIAAVTTLICLLVSYPVAYYIALQADARWKSLLLVLSIAPFWTSFLLRTYAWMFLLRSEGLINSVLLRLGLIDQPLSWLLYSTFAVIVGQVYGELPFMIFPLYVSLERLDRRLIEAALDLGANRFWAFLRVVVPLTRAGIVTAVVLVFIPSLGAFITPDLLGGARTAMIGTLIQNQFMQRNQPLGSAFAVVLTTSVLLLLAIALRVGWRAHGRPTRVEGL